MIAVGGKAGGADRQKHQITLAGIGNPLRMSLGDDHTVTRAHDKAVAGPVIHQPRPAFDQICFGGARQAVKLGRDAGLDPAARD